MKFVSVKFIENHPPYVKGELAGFPEKRADALINGGVAVPVDARNPRAAAGIKALRTAPETRHIPGPENTKSGGAGSTRRCGNCGKPGHTKTACPELEDESGES